jgi:hypothetical protein
MDSIKTAPAKGAKGHEEFMQNNGFAFTELIISPDCNVYTGVMYQMAGLLSLL